MDLELSPEKSATRQLCRELVRKERPHAEHYDRLEEFPYPPVARLAGTPPAAAGCGRDRGPGIV